jgi:hypothetical protein
MISTPYFGIFLHAAKYDMGQTALLPSEGRRAEDFFALKSAGFEHANSGTRGEKAYL